MNVGLIIFYVLSFAELLLAAYKHGKPKGEGRNNFLATLIMVVILLTLVLSINDWSFL